MTGHSTHVLVNIEVKEGQIVFTGEEIEFKFNPLRPRHIRLAYEIQAQIRQIVRTAQDFNEENK